MIDQILEIAEHATSYSKRELYKILLGQKRPITKPADMISLAGDFCRHIESKIHQGDDDLRIESAVALLLYLARLPKATRQAIDKIECFADKPLPPWQEADHNAYIGVCNVVRDIWDHLFGLEAGESRAIVSYVDNSVRTKRILDWGCGAGFYSIALARRGWQVSAIDIDPQKMEFLKFRMANEPNISINFTFEDNYPAILCVNVLDHCEDPAQVFRQMASHGAEGGHLFIQAEFPDDGWHVSDDAIVASLSEEIKKHHRLWPSRQCVVPWFDHFVKSNSDNSAKKSGPQRFALHPRAKIYRKIKNCHEYYIGIQSAFSMPIAIDKNHIPILDKFDGIRSIQDIADVSRISDDQVTSLSERYLINNIIQ